MSKAYKTAIKRKALSAPVKLLVAANRIVGRVLDYGCGRGDDARSLGCEGYDPHYRPDRPVGTFETIMCNYVLNVIESEDERREVLRDIDGLLDRHGRAYITVRNDRKKLKGYTSTGSWQGLIYLDLRIVNRCSGYVTYLFRKGDSECVMLATTEG